MTEKKWSVVKMLNQNGNKWLFVNRNKILLKTYTDKNDLLIIYLENNVKVKLIQLQNFFYWQNHKCIQSICLQIFKVVPFLLSPYFYVVHRNGHSSLHLKITPIWSKWQKNSCSTLYLINLSARSASWTARHNNAYFSDSALCALLPKGVILLVERQFP